MYSDNASVQVSFTSIQEKSVIADKIRKILYLGGSTYTNRGLEMSYSLFTTAKGGRLDIPRALVVISDGRSSGENSH